MRLIENIEAHPDREFLEVVERLVGRTAVRLNLQEIFLVEIDNWFDQKWLGYSGKAFVQSPFSAAMDGAPDAALDGIPDAEKRIQSIPAVFRKIPLTLPPFPPSRVLRELYFRRTENNEFSPAERAQPIHSRERESSSANLHRSILNISESALFAWFSSNATKNGAASLMVYITRGDEFNARFLAFRKKQRWKIISITRLARRRLSRKATSDKRPARRSTA